MSESRPTSRSGGLEAWDDDVPLRGEGAPKNDGSIKHLIEYLLTVYERFGNTTVTNNLQWGATALWKRDELQERIAELEKQLSAHSETRAVNPLQEHYDRLAEEVSRLQNLINTPELEDFLQGVKVEQAHQVERWGDAHDRSKSAENWYWLVGYLAGKALRSATSGDRDKALHHTISSAAALFQWHKAIARDTSGAGIGNDQDLQPDEVKR